MKLRMSPVAAAFFVPFSALGRAVWDETTGRPAIMSPAPKLSVLSVEPYGMKPRPDGDVTVLNITFSALGRAVWDETASTRPRRWPWLTTFSALGRAVWDETAC